MKITNVLPKTFFEKFIAFALISTINLHQNTYLSEKNMLPHIIEDKINLVNYLLSKH